MPILNVKVSAQRSAEMTQKISDTLLELTSRILGKDPKVTAIAIERLDAVPVVLDLRACRFECCVV